MRRALLFSASFALLVALAWWLLTPAPRELRFAQPPDFYGFVDARAVKGLDTAQPVLTLLTQLAPAAQRAQAKQQATTIADAQEISIGVGFRRPNWEWRVGPPTPAETSVQVVPTLALQQLAAIPHGYLLLRSETPATLAAEPRLRRWLGVAMCDTLAQAKAATIVVGEESTPARAQVGLCLEFARPEDAVAAVQRIATPAAGNVLSFKVSPQAEAVARRTGLVVIRFEVDALYLRLAAQPR